MKTPITELFEWIEANFHEENFDILSAKETALKREQQMVVDARRPLIELLKEIRYKLLFDLDGHGEPNSDLNSLLKMWEKVNDELKEPDKYFLNTLDK